LPSLPQIFHGRDSEVHDVVTSLLQEEARVIILGAGGVGKTSLARTSMHHDDVLAKFADRYFVSCDSSQTVEDLMVAVASALRLELPGKLSQKIIKFLSATQSCLLVLDNFETPWEPPETRGKVEEFLALLGDLPQVALLVTMRGQERPLKIRWTRPFIQPLQPLTAEAARQTFMDISDSEGRDDIFITELLDLTGNLPIAVTLMAYAASFEGCEAVLLRWKHDNISILSEGHDKETNLETSLRLSISSPRMTSSPGALQLLGLLSLLPDGILDADLLNSACAIPDIPRSKSTLLRTSLAYLDGDRLKILVPVREFIKKMYPP
ncbi:P-loop containing nucleoside triphosphate hydrolase protein, partial [Mycena latifolia]